MAAKAFANQPQFWKDFSSLFNSDFLKQRRSGLKNDVNADEIAMELSPGTPESSAIASGKKMLSRIDNLIQLDHDFAFETTLASRIFVERILVARENGFRAKLFFYWINSPDLAVRRVENRVRKGGHSVPEEVIRRRYYKGICNLFDLYIDQCDYWAIYDNSNITEVLVAEGNFSRKTEINKIDIFTLILKQYENTRGEY